MLPTHKKPVIVLGVDPGYDRCGIAVVEQQHNKDVLLWSSCITPVPGALDVRFLEIGTVLEHTITKWCPKILACEKIFFTKNQKTGIAVAELRGIIRYIATQHALSFLEFTPQEIKRAVTGYGNADKRQVSSMVRTLLMMDATRRHDDEYDAIAVALTARPLMR